MKRKVYMTEAIEELGEILLERVDVALDIADTALDIEEVEDEINESELMVFNLFVIDFTAQISLKDPIPFLDACYPRLLESISLEFGNPILNTIERLFEPRFAEYSSALKTKKPPNYIHWIGKAVCKNVFAEDRADDILYILVGAHIWHNAVLTYKTYFDSIEIEV